MRSKTLVAVEVLVVFAASAVQASVTFTPPPKSEKKMNMAMIRLAPQKSAPKASGMASLIANKDKTRCKLAIEVSGLDPKKVYTAWLWKPWAKPGLQQQSGQTQGIGVAPYKLKVDAHGNAKIISQDMDVKAMMTWRKIEIVENRSKNPNNMLQIAYVLTGDATKLR